MLRSMNHVNNDLSQPYRTDFIGIYVFTATGRRPVAYPQQRGSFRVGYSEMTHVTAPTCSCFTGALLMRYSVGAT